MAPRAPKNIQKQPEAKEVLPPPQVRVIPALEAAIPIVAVGEDAANEAIAAQRAAVAAVGEAGNVLQGQGIADTEEVPHNGLNVLPEIQGAAVGQQIQAAKAHNPETPGRGRKRRALEAPILQPDIVHVPAVRQPQALLPLQQQAFPPQQQLQGNQQLAAAMFQANQGQGEADDREVQRAMFANVLEENKRLQIKLAESDNLAGQAAVELKNYRSELVNSQQRNQELQQGFNNLRESLVKNAGVSHNLISSDNEIRLARYILNNYVNRISIIKVV